MRRLLPLSAFMLLAVSALAQLTSGQKVEVLRAMDRVLTEEAFVPGVDLGRWPDFLKRRQGDLEDAESTWEFAQIVNGALREFGISHIRLASSARSGRRRGDELLLLQRRGYYSQESLRWLDQETAVLRIGSFTSYRSSAVEQQFDEAQKAKYLILDLRSNPGGLVDNMQHLLGQLLPDGTAIGTFISRRTAEAFIRAGKGDGKDPVAIANWTDRKFRVRTSGNGFKGKIAVLVNRGSGSASEIVASALRETIGAPLIGSPTAGAVLMSTFQRLPHGFQLQFPISDYVSIKGRRLEGNPLVPDVETGSESSGVYEAALERLRRG